MKFSKYILHNKGIAFLFIVVASISVKAQSIDIKGTILIESSKTPLIGASITVKGQEESVISNVGGYFGLKVKSLPATISVSSVGFKSQEIDIYEAEPLTIYLTEDFNKLTEVVVVGYSTQKKQDFTGSAVHISGDEFKEAPIQSFDQALAGKATGVSISLPNGVLNNPPVIKIRGANSISLSSYPLVVVE